MSDLTSGGTLGPAGHPSDPKIVENLQQQISNPEVNQAPADATAGQEDNTEKPGMEQ